jgi:hypothetical protein
VIRKLQFSKNLFSKLAGISICLTMLAVAVLPPAPAEAAERPRAIIVNNNMVASNGEILRGGPMTLSKNSADGTPWTLDPANWVRMKRAGLNVGRLVLFDFENRRETLENPSKPVPYWTVSEILPKLDIAVDNAEAAGMYIVINFHDVGDFTPAVLNEFWAAAAGRYKNRTHVIYEIANEPIKGPASTTNPTNGKLANLAYAYRIIRNLAPNTPVLHLSFPNAQDNMNERVNRYIQEVANLPLINDSYTPPGGYVPMTLDFTDGKNAVAFHTYGTTTSAAVVSLKNNFPVFCTEWGYLNTGQDAVKVWNGTAFNGQVLESLGISWLDWKGGRKDIDFIGQYMRRFLPDARQKNYIWTAEGFTGGFNNNFDSGTVDSDSFGWTTVGGTVVGDNTVIKAFPTASNKSVRLGDTSATESRSINRSFTAQSHNVALEFRFYQATKVKNFTAQLRDGTTVGPQIITEGGNLKYVDSSGATHNIMAYNASTWYNIVLAANSDTDQYDVFVNGVQKFPVNDLRDANDELINIKPGAPYRNATTKLDNVFFSTGEVETGATFVDNIIISNP